MISSASKKAAQKRYYQKHKEYYKDKAREDSINVRKERNKLRDIVERALKSNSIEEIKEILNESLKR